MIEAELSLLLALDGSDFEMAPGVVVEFTARLTDVTPQRPHGISYAFVLRHEDGGSPWLKFDNAHSVEVRNRGYRRKRVDYDHWHRTEKDKGRPYEFTTVAQLLDDFWVQVKRVLDERGIPNTL
jgi:hypothetical protein